MRSTKTRRSGALHEDIGREIEVKGSSDRSFGLVFVAVLVVIGLWSLPSGGAPLWWAIGAALVLAAIALVRPSLLAPANRLWFRFGMLLGRVTTPIVLGVIFFGVVTPTALLMRMTGRDLLRLRRESAGAGWLHRDQGAIVGSDMSRQF